MPFDAFRFKVFSRRVFILSTLQIVAFAIVILRLFKFQILDYNYFKNKSDGNRIKTTIIPPKRGIIFDRENAIMASNTQYYRIILKRSNYKSDILALNKLAEILKFSEKGRKNLILEYNKNKLQKEVIVYRYLTRKELLQVEFNLHLLPQFAVGIGIARVYSNPFAFSNLLGYVMQVPPSEIKAGKYIAHPDVKIGAEGIEKFYDNELLGKHGIEYTEVNAMGIKIADIETKQPIDGKDIKISINSIIQKFAYYLANEKKGAIVLLDILTGELLSMVSTPSFDINLLSQKIDNFTWNALVNNPQKPLINRPIQSAFAPGSIYKIITAIVALESGINADDTVNCTGQIYIHNMLRRCWLEKGHGRINLRNSIKHSCNIMFYNIGASCKNDLFVQVGKELCIGENFDDFEFQKQNVGINPNDAWKRANLKEAWYPGDNVNLAIGQGFVKTNGLQLAVMMARIASLGKKIQPRLTVWDKDFLPEFDEININPAFLQFVKRGLFEGTNSAGGTSYGSRIFEKGFEFSGKTGTAQVVSKFLQKHEYSDLTRPHGLFAGFAPFENSRFAASVIMENGGFGSSSAAPIGKNLLYFTQLLYANRINDAKKLCRNLGMDVSLIFT